MFASTTSDSAPQAVAMAGSSADVASEHIAEDGELDPKCIMMHLISFNFGIHQDMLQARVENSDGVLEPVEDAGGRQRLREVVLDVQSVARSLDRRGRLAVEVACANAEQMLAVDPVTLAVPSQGKPLNAWDARTWPCCFTEWWFGDGAPNLARQRPMLFEEVAAMLLEREELQYFLEADEAPYTARAPSRFVAPEIVAVLGDVRRRLALLRGTRAATQRRGYKKDLQSICGATPEDYEAALGLARPRDSILAGQCNADGSGD